MVFILHTSMFQPLPSSDLDRFHVIMSFNPNKSHTIQKDRLANTLIYFLNNPLEEVHSNSWVLDQTTFQNLPPKPITHWASSILQSLSLAHLNSYPPTIHSSAAWWSTALSSGLAHLPHIFIPWKPRPSRLLGSPAMKLSLSTYHRHITDRSVVVLSSTPYFLVLHPLLFLRFVLSGVSRARVVHQ